MKIFFLRSTPTTSFLFNETPRVGFLACFAVCFFASSRAFRLSFSRRLVEGFSFSSPSTPCVRCRLPRALMGRPLAQPRTGRAERRGVGPTLPRQFEQPPPPAPPRRPLPLTRAPPPPRRRQRRRTRCRHRPPSSPRWQPLRRRPKRAPLSSLTPRSSPNLTSLPPSSRRRPPCAPSPRSRA